MIERYSRPEMAEIWEENNKFKIWLEIERLACEAQVKLKNIPPSVLDNFKNKIVKFDIKRINEIEKIVKHDVIAFLTYLKEESLNIDLRYLHYGMTSSDVLDTCLSVQLNRSCDILLKSIEKILSVLKSRAIEFKYTTCIGRSHGVHAEPVTFGLKLARFYAEFSRSYSRLKIAKEEVSTCKISGAVGTFAHVDPFVEKYVSTNLGLKPETISSQIIPRDRHAFFFSVIAIIASSIENLATEIRHLQKTEVLEVTESFKIGQKGSSAMPHKKNPIFSENLTGLSRIIRSFVVPALENVTLWHERDISHSSVERFICPDACITLDFALHRLYSLLVEMSIDETSMKKNMQTLNGLIFSQGILLELIKSGLTREDSYSLVQKNAMKVWKNGTDFLDELKKDENVLQYISIQKLDSLFRIDYYIKNVDLIFNSVFQSKS